jgi:hypothetical protein
VFSKTGHAVQAAIMKRGRRRLDIGRRNFQHFGGRVHDQAGKPSVVLNHQNPVSLAHADFLFAEPFAQVDHRDNLAAQVDYAFHVVRRVGNCGDFRHTNNLVQRSDGNAIGLASHLKADNV